MTITLVSVLVALVVGLLETLSVVSSQLSLSGPFWNLVDALSGGNNFGKVGLGIIVLLILCWGISTLIYRVKKYDELEPRLSRTALKG
jgi:high-affinity nickel-transport protein